MHDSELNYGGYKKDYPKMPMKVPMLFYMEQTFWHEQYDRSMIKYDGEDIKVEIRPNTHNGSSELVLVRHDKPCLSSYRGKGNIWLDDNHLLPICRKGEGKSNMVWNF